ncbi:MAG TPA: ParB N-terminal domain-containing protein [Gemmataceae bacterium]|nr:ParB N-terminal domain-containing protein [Gemmataceae bacterium]
MIEAKSRLSTEERIVRKRVESLHPSPENELLYRPMDDDPGILALAKRIRDNGCDPLLVTLDNYIVSGHRRQAALKLLGQEWVRCRVLQVYRECMDRDNYVKLLRSFNEQRHKSVAEQIREELVDIDPDQAILELEELRFRASHPEEKGVEVLAIEGTKKRHEISEQKADHVKFVKQVVFTDRREYWPLSVRGAHYALLNYSFMRNIPRKIPYKNDDESYHATSDLITRLRLNGDIPWKAFDDTTRPLKDFQPFGSVGEFVRQESRNMFTGYWRNLLQSQAAHIEVLVEKNTV